MSKQNILIIAILVGIFIIGSATYNDLNTKEEAVFAAWGNLDASLQRRSDLIPNLVNTVKGYAAHEQRTLEGVINARAKATTVTFDASKLNDEKAIAAFMAQQNEIKSALGKLMVIAEQYPDLKANQNFLDLQHQIEGTENRINYSRVELNKTIQEFNTSIRRFPNSIVNSLFAHLDKKCFFEAGEESKKAPLVMFKDL